MEKYGKIWIEDEDVVGPWFDGPFIIWPWILIDLTWQLKTASLVNKKQVDQRFKSPPDLRPPPKI